MNNLLKLCILLFTNYMNFIQFFKNTLVDLNIVMKRQTIDINFFEIQKFKFYFT